MAREGSFILDSGDTFPTLAMDTVAQYSSGPIGRLVWQDILGLVQSAKKAAG